MARVLKPGRKLSLAYNTLDEDSWYILAEIMQQHGLHFAEATTIAYSAASVVQDNRQKGLSCDLLLTWQKPSPARPHRVPKLQRARIEGDVRVELLSHLQAANRGMRASELLSEALIHGLTSGRIYAIGEILDLVGHEFTADGLIWRPGDGGQRQPR